MQQIRRLLLTQYIGAIAIGYLLGRGTEAFFAAFMPILNTILAGAFRDREFMRDPWPAVRVSLIANLALTFLYYFFAYVFASWLYPGSVAPAQTSESRDPNQQ